MDLLPDQNALIELYAPRDRSTPRVRVNFVASLDGAVTVNGGSNDLSDSDDQRVFGLLRLLADVVLVGAGTFRYEGYHPIRLDPDQVTWRRDHGMADHPVLAIVSRGLTGLAGHPAITGAPVRPIVFTDERSPAAVRERLAEDADVIVCGQEIVDADQMLGELTTRGLPQVLSEGGPELFGHLLAAGRVDDLCLTMSPLLAGPGADRIIAGPPVTAGLSMVPRHALVGRGGSVFLRHSRQGLD